MGKVVINPTLIENSTGLEVRAEGYIDYNATQALNSYIVTGIVSNFQDRASTPKFGGEFNMLANKDGSVKVGKYWITRVIHNNPATIVFWNDGTKTVARTQDGDPYDPTAGLLVCVMKKMIGNEHTQKLLNDWGCCTIIDYGPMLGQEYDYTDITIKDIRKKYREK